MVLIRLFSFVIALFLGFTLAAPLKAQASATLHISARVIQECTVTASSKLELFLLARQLNDPTLIARCSKGVLSKVDRRVVGIGDLRPRTALPGRSVGQRVVRSTVEGKTDVVLVTVSY